jgi:CBS domain-containing protein
MKVSDIMTREVRSCTLNAALTQVAKEMWSVGCGAIPIIDTQAKVAGIITDRDISMALVNTARKPSTVPAREAMTEHVHSCAPEDDVKTALETMGRFHVRRLPVVSATGQLLGIVSIDDVVLRALEPDAPTPAEIVDGLRRILTNRRMQEESAMTP